MPRGFAKVAVIFLAIAVTAAGAAAAFDFLLEWRSLDEINSRDGTSLTSFDFNSPQSELQLLGGFFANSPSSWDPAIDTSRGLLYEPQFPPGGGMFSAVGGGSIAVIDLKTLSIRRTLVVHSGTETVTPVAVAVDPLGNRLFVSDFQARRVWTIDAVSGAVQWMYQCASPCIAGPYSPTTNRLFINFSSTASALLDLGNLDAPLVALPTLPDSRFYSSYFVVDDDAKLMYSATERPFGFVAIDIDPQSPTFSQIVWNEVGVGSYTVGGGYGYLQPALDHVRHRLYVPDVNAGNIDVFSTAPGPDFRRLVQVIPIADQVQANNPQHFVGVMVVPEVDQLTGLVYVLVTSDCDRVVEYCAPHPYRSFVFTIDPAVGTAAEASLGLTFDGAFIMHDPGTRRMIVGSPGGLALERAVLEDRRSAVLTTPPGTATTVSAPEATITFSNVSSAGVTTIASESIAGVDVQLPGQFTIDGGLLYEISTSATVAGPITLCFSAAHINDPAAFDALHVLHAENGAWVDRTSSRDFRSRVICATTTSLSPFAIAKLTTSAYSPRLLYTIDRSFKAGSSAPIRVQVLDWTGTNVSSPALALTAVTLRRTGDNPALTVEDSGQANSDANFRFDTSLAGYIFNLSTKGFGPGTYTLTAKVGAQGNYIQLPFSVR